MDRSMSDTYRRIRSAILSTLEQADDPVSGEELDATVAAAARVTIKRARNARFRLTGERTITNLDRIDGSFYVLGSDLTGQGGGAKTALERRMVAALDDGPLDADQVRKRIEPIVPERVARDVLEALTRRGVVARNNRARRIRYSNPTREEQPA